MADNADAVHVNHGLAERVAAGYRDLILSSVGKPARTLLGNIDSRDLLLLVDAYEETLRMLRLWWYDPDNPPSGVSIIAMQLHIDGTGAHDGC